MNSDLDVNAETTRRYSGFEGTYENLAADLRETIRFRIYYLIATQDARRESGADETRLLLDYAQKLRNEEGLEEPVYVDNAEGHLSCQLECGLSDKIRQFEQAQRMELMEALRRDMDHRYLHVNDLLSEVDDLVRLVAREDLQ